MFEVAEKEFGGVDVLVNNAGIMLLSSVATTDDTDFEPKELRGRSMTVNAIAPGPTATELFLHGKSQELIDRMAKIDPLERLGRPQDICSKPLF